MDIKKTLWMAGAFVGSRDFRRFVIWDLAPEDAKKRFTEALSTLQVSGWHTLAPSSGLIEDEENALVRNTAVDASRVYAKRDSFYGHGIRTTRNYIFGRGVTWKAADQRTDKTPKGEQTVSDVLARFWQDSDNWLMTRAKGQWELAETLLTDGEVYLVFFVNHYSGHVKVADVDCKEVTAIIRDPKNWRKILYYRREWQSVTYDWKGNLVRAPKAEVDYYPDWGAPNTALSYETSKDDGPDIVDTAADERDRLDADKSGVERATVGDDGTHVYMMQIKVNGKKRGLPPMYSGIRPAKVHRGSLQDWATLMVAAATFAFKQKLKGNKSAMARIKAQWSNYDMGRYGGDYGRERREGGQTIMENEATDLQQFTYSLPAGDWYMGLRMIRQQMATAADMTEVDFTSDSGVGSLATAVAMAATQQKGFEAWQQLWSDVYVDVFNFVTRMAVRYGSLTLVKPDKEPRDLTVEIDFPPIVVKSLGDVIGAISSLVSAQSLRGREIIPAERLARYALAAFGETDIDKALAELADVATVPGGLESYVDEEGLPDEYADKVAHVLEALGEIVAERRGVT